MTPITINVGRHTRKGRAVNLNPWFKVLDVPLVRDFSAYPDFKFKESVKTDEREFINSETGKRVGKVSGVYKLTTHAEARHIITGFLDRLGIEYRSTGAQVAGNGAVCYETFQFPTLAFNPAKDTDSTAFDSRDPRRDDLIPTLTWTNSYNRTTPIIISKGLLRLLCENGLTLPNGHEEDVLRFRHNRLPDVGLVHKRLVEMLENTQRVGAAVFKRLNSEGGTAHLEAVLNADFSDKFKKQVIDRLNTLEGDNFDIVPKLDEKGKTVSWEIQKVRTKASAYAIWNVVTDISSHQISNRKEREAVDNRIARIFVPADL